MMTDSVATDYLMFPRAAILIACKHIGEGGEGKQNLISQASPHKV